MYRIGAGCTQVNSGHKASLSATRTYESPERQNWSLGSKQGHIVNKIMLHANSHIGIF